MSIFSLPRTKSDWFVLIIRLVVGGFFLYASIDKIMNPEGFARAIHNYRMLPPQYINFLAILFPWLELTGGLSLIIGYRYKGASLLLFVMLIIFGVALTSALARGLNINCGCFSTSSTAKSNLLMRLIEDFLLLLGCVIIMLQNKLFGYSSRLSAGMP